MFKQIIFLIYIFSFYSCFGSEEVVYSDIMALYNRDLARFLYQMDKQEMDQFLQDHQISSLELYNILRSKKFLIEESAKKLGFEIHKMKHMQIPSLLDYVWTGIINIILPPLGTMSTHAQGVASLYGQMFLGLLYGIVGVPTFLVGIGMRALSTPSPRTTSISKGLIATGGILSLPLSHFVLTNIIIPKIDPKTKKMKEQQRLLSEIDIINNVMDTLKKMYPDLHDAL